MNYKFQRFVSCAFHSVSVLDYNSNVAPFDLLTCVHSNICSSLSPFCSESLYIIIMIIEIILMLILNLILLTNTNTNTNNSNNTTTTTTTTTTNNNNNNNNNKIFIFNQCSQQTGEIKTILKVIQILKIQNYKHTIPYSICW